MKSPLEAPEKSRSRGTEETSAKPERPAPVAVIDTSKMVKGQREALELAEAARDPLEDRGSFASNLFIGRYDFSRIHPYPAQSAERRAPRDFRVRADGMERRLGPGQHESARRADRRRLSVHPERRKTLVHESDQGWRACGDGTDAVENGRRPRAQTDHRVYCRCRFAWTRDYVSLSFHGFARALQRDREIHQRPRAARKHDREGRPGLEGRAHDSEHRQAYTSSCGHRFVQAVARDLPEMGGRTDSMGCPDRQTRGDRGKNRGDGRQ